MPTGIYKRISPSDSFYRRLDRSPNGCWNWIGYKDKDGYGKIKIKKKSIGVHRYSWILHKGEIPDGMCVLHKCDNPSCVNPSHLFIGTPMDNMRDKTNKGRHYYPGAKNPARGEKQALHKLTEKDVRHIISLRKKGHTYKEIADIFRVDLTQVGNIVKGRQWNWLTKIKSPPTPLPP